MQNPYGYPVPPQRSGPSAAVVVLIVLVVLAILGMGGCLLCAGIFAAMPDDAARSDAAVRVQPTSDPAVVHGTTDDTEPTATATATAKPKPTARPTPPPTVAPGPASPSGPRVVDFVCPPGKPPGGAVRAGCLCGSEILGTACGAPGNFVDVVETARGCRFTCAP